MTESEMENKRLNYIKYLVPVSVVLVFTFFHQVYVTRAHPDAVYMDSLRLVYQLEQWRQGQLSFWSLWGLGGEHQGFIAQFILLLNVKYLSFNVLLANRMTGVIVALVAIVLLLDFNSTIRKYPVAYPGTLLLARLGVSALIVVTCFSWAGFELFTLDLGLPLWLKNLSFVTYFSLHATYLTKRYSCRSNWTLGLGLTLVGPVIVLMMGMGWSYSFVAAVILVYLLVAIDSFKGHALRTLLSKSAPTLALLMAQIGYITASASAGKASAHHQVFSTLSHVPGLLFYSLGSGLIGVETADKYPLLRHALPFLSCGALVAAVVLVLARCGRKLHEGSLFPFYLLAYGFLTALSVSIARGAEGGAAVMASRYYMDIMFFYVGLIWLWYDSLERMPAAKHDVSKALFLLLCVTIVLGQSLTYRNEWASAPYRAMAFKSMNQALLQGVPDEQAASLLQSPLDNARKGNDVLLRKNLALYSERSKSACVASDIQYLSGWYTRESQGIWVNGSAAMQIPSCRCDFIATVYLPSDFPRRTMTVSTSEFSRAIDLKPGLLTSLHVPPSSFQRTLKIRVSETTVPSSLPQGGPDTRSLGALWTSSSFSCAAGARE